MTNKEEFYKIFPDKRKERLICWDCKYEFTVNYAFEELGREEEECLRYPNGKLIRCSKCKSSYILYKSYGPKEKNGKRIYW